MPVHLTDYLRWLLLSLSSFKEVFYNSSKQPLSQPPRPLKPKQIPPPITILPPNPPLPTNGFPLPTIKLLQRSLISSISNAAFIATEQPADNETFRWSSVAVILYCVCL